MARGISGGIAKKKVKRITPKQKAARRRNIAIARKYRKKDGRSSEARFKKDYARNKKLNEKLRRKRMGKSEPSIWKAWP